MSYISSNNWPLGPQLSRGAMRVLLRNPVLVFSHDSNPNCDRWLYCISQSEAQARIERGYVQYLTPNRVQLKPPPGYTPDQTGMIAGGEFKSAWQPRFSANYLVWQMRPQRDPEVPPDETDKS